MKQRAATVTVSQCQLEAFQKCSVEIIKKLDVKEITPYLNSHGLLTQHDLQTLLNKITTVEDKSLYLLEALPRKDRFFEKFLDCLHQTKFGTGHGAIHEALLTNYRNSQVDVSAVFSSVQTTDSEEVHAYE